MHHFGFEFAKGADVVYSALLIEGFDGLCPDAFTAACGDRLVADGLVDGAEVGFDHVASEVLLSNDPVR